MAVYQLLFAFNGTRYHGWQTQPGHLTVEQTMEELLQRVFDNRAITLSGCSRTDSGVHAVGMTASFRTDRLKKEEELFSILDRQLPHDIRIRSVKIMPDGWDAHRAATGKSYIYAIHPGGYSLFLKDHVWSWDEPADQKRIKEALALLKGKHDFQNFTRGKEEESGSTVRTIFRAETVSFGPVMCFCFAGDGFLNKMVRRMTGLIREVNRNKLSVPDFQRCLTEPGFCPMPDAVAPSHGLYLNRVFYTQADQQIEDVEFPPFFF